LIVLSSLKFIENWFVKASGYSTKTSNHRFQPISKLPNDLGNWLESEDYLNWSTQLIHTKAPFKNYSKLFNPETIDNCLSTQSTCALIHIGIRISTIRDKITK
jgi:hypothetical protein